MLDAPDNIRSARLLLRRPKLSDAQATFEYGSDLAVARYMDWPMHSSVQDAIRVTENAVKTWGEDGQFSWRVTVPPNDIPIGAIGCSIAGHSAYIGYVLARQHWGRGYATEAARALFTWLASQEHILRIHATCDVDNSASVRVLEKIGMSREAILRRWALRPNLPGHPLRDAFMYAWVRDA